MPELPRNLRNSERPPTTGKSGGSVVITERDNADVEEEKQIVRVTLLEENNQLLTNLTDGDCFSVTAHP